MLNDIRPVSKNKIKKKEEVKEKKKKKWLMNRLQKLYWTRTLKQKIV